MPLDVVRMAFSRLLVMRVQVCEPRVAVELVGVHSHTRRENEMRPCIDMVARGK
jgi:hypothetical protein